MAPNVTVCWDVRRDDLDYALLRTLSGQLRRIQPYYFGDYYPLTPYSDAADQWMAWQFNRPDLRAGMVQAFRRPQSGDESAQLKLRGLEPDASYVVSDLETGEAKTLAGRDLLERGLTVTLKARPAAAVIVYERQ
jgi:alpha-galactosidase